MKAEPRFVDAVLDWPPTWFVARLLLVGAYLVGALAKLGDWPGAVAEQAHFGMHPPAFWAAVTIAVELVGPALILAGRLVWLGAGMLGVFTVLAACLANPFWAMQGAALCCHQCLFRASRPGGRLRACRAGGRARAARGAHVIARRPACWAMPAALLATAAQAQSADQGADQADALPRSVIEAWRPPTLTITRYTENWSALADPALRQRRWTGPLKYVPLGSPDRYLSTGLELRARVEASDGQTARYWRAMAHADLHLGRVRLFVQGLANAAGGSSAAPLRSIAPASIWCRPLPT
jgi:uncharacterized membrane protein YphA (DoxX/SURF4 family)